MVTTEAAPITILMYIFSRSRYLTFSLLRADRFSFFFRETRVHLTAFAKSTIKAFMTLRFSIQLSYIYARTNKSDFFILLEHFIFFIVPVPGFVELEL